MNYNPRLFIRKMLIVSLAGLSTDNFIRAVKCLFPTLAILLINWPVLHSQSTGSPIRVIPPTPEASIMEKFLEFPAVSSTGIPDISISLHQLKLKGYTLPISISYHASGVKVNDIATPVGLNWVLNAGAYISRTIIGKADELSNFYIDSGIPTTTCNQDYLKYYYEGLYDASPDIFSYFLPGRQGKFIIKSGALGLEVKKSNQDPVKIVPATSPLTFYLFDEFGNKYTFISNREQTLIDIIDNSGETQSSLDHLNGSGYVGWKLDKITVTGLWHLRTQYRGLPESGLSQNMTHLTDR